MWGDIAIGTIFDTFRPTLTPKTGVELADHNLTLEMLPNGDRSSKRSYQEALESRGWAFDW